MGISGSGNIWKESVMVPFSRKHPQGLGEVTIRVVLGLVLVLGGIVAITLIFAVAAWLWPVGG